MAQISSLEKEIRSHEEFLSSKDIIVFDLLIT